VINSTQSTKAVQRDGDFLESWYCWLSALDLIRNDMMICHQKLTPILKQSVPDLGSPDSEGVKINLPFLAHPLWLRPDTSDVLVASQVFMQRSYFHKSLLSLSPKFILDAGANIGLSAIFFAKLFPGVRILCVEPESSNYALLRKNVSSYPQIEVVQAGLWGSECTLRIANPGGDRWAFRTVKSEAGDGVLRGMSVDEICQLYGETTIDILKIDIEGAEKEVFAVDATSWLKRVHVLMIELHDRLVAGCARSVYSAVSEFAFQKHQLGELDIIVFER
jgi:FkbM family methyltransferase